MSKYFVIISRSENYPSDERAITVEKAAVKIENATIDNECKLVEIIKQDGLNETVIYGESCSRCENNTKHLGIVECLECSLHYESKFKEVQK